MGPGISTILIGRLDLTRQKPQSPFTMIISAAGSEARTTGTPAMMPPLIGNDGTQRRKQATVPTILGHNGTKCALSTLEPSYPAA